MNWIKYLPKWSRRNFILLTILNISCFSAGIIMMFIKFSESYMVVFVLPLVYFILYDSVKNLAEVKKRRFDK